MAIDKAVDSARLDLALTASANALRTKMGKTEKIDFDPDTGFEDAITNLPTSGRTFKAFESISEVSDDKISKNLVALPDSFKSVCGYTDTKEQLTITVPGEAGDTIVCAFAVRQYEQQPPTPAGWNFIGWSGATKYPSINTTNQTVVIFSKTLSDGETSCSCTMPQIDASQRLYGLGVNIKKCILTRNLYVVSDILPANQSKQYDIEYENTIFFVTCPASLSKGNGNPDEAKFGHKCRSLYTEFQFPDYGDGSTNGGRLDMGFIPFKSEQSQEKLEMDCINKDHIQITSETEMTVCFLEIELNGVSRYLSGNSYTQAWANKLSNSELLNIILGGEV